MARENRAAASNQSLEPTDPRWVLAAHTHAQLQGTTLTPERRQRLLRVADLLGVRPFEANVIMAIVQDHARQRLPLGEAQAMLALLSRPQRPRRALWFRWLAALAFAVVVTVLLIAWLVGK
ncbi:MAG: hypothetical protein ACYSXF_09325 [Planctomycetota bacterium]